MRKNCILSIIAAIAAGLSVTSANASSIAPGNLVVYRVGDNAAALTTAAASVFLDEYTTTGAFVQSIPVPNAGPLDMTATGNSTTEGIISRSQDGSSLIFTGYRKAAGGTAPASDTYVTTPRVIGTLTAAGVANTATTMINDNGATTANALRSATSVDGTSSFWTSTATRIGFYGSGIGSSAGTVQIDARNSRQVNLSGNTLFAANGSTSLTGKVQTYGSLPIGATAATPAVTLALADAVNGFALFDLDAGVVGDDTMYLLSTVENLLRKYTFNGATWSASGSVSANNALNLTGYASGGTVNLFLTSATTLLAEVDSSGYNANIASPLVSLTTAAANSGAFTAYRGIGMFPTVAPEPTSLCLVAIGAGAALLRRRKA